MIKYRKKDIDGYVGLERRTLRIIRKYIIKATKKHVAEVCHISPATVHNVERLGVKVRPSTLLKVFQFYHDALLVRGWRPVRPEASNV